MAILNDKNELISKNEVTITGLLKEKDLEYNETKTTIKGKLVIQYGQAPSDQTEINVYVNSTKKNGEPNTNQFQKAQDLMKLVSEAEATPERPADWITATGNKNFTPNVSIQDSYDVVKDEFNIFTKISLGFGSVYVINKENCVPRAEFDISCFLLEAPIEKTDNNNNPYLMLKLGLVEYNGQAKPLECVVRDKSLLRGISRLKKGDTCNFWGIPRIAFIEKKVEKKGGLGGVAKVDIVRQSYREFEITGGDQITPQEPLGFQIFTPEVITKSLTEREVMLEQVKNKAIEKKNGSFRKGQGGLGSFGGFGGGGFGQANQEGGATTGGFGQPAGISMESSPF